MRIIRNGLGVLAEGEPAEFECCKCLKRTEDEEDFVDCCVCGKYVCLDCVVNKEYQGYQESFCSVKCKKM